MVTNPRKAAQALQKVVQEMEFRYEKFAATGVRNITGYNQLIQQKMRKMAKIVRFCHLLLSLLMS